MCGTSSKNINEDDYDRSEFHRNVCVRGNKKKKKCFNKWILRYDFYNCRSTLEAINPKR